MCRLLPAWSLAWGCLVACLCCCLHVSSPASSSLCLNAGSQRSRQAQIAAPQPRTGAPPVLQVPQDAPRCRSSLVQPRAVRQSLVQFFSKSRCKSQADVCPNTQSLVQPQAVINPVASPDARSLSQLRTILRRHSVARPMAQPCAVYRPLFLIRAVADPDTRTLGKPLPSHFCVEPAPGV